MGDAHGAKKQDAPRAFWLKRSFFAKLALWMLLVSGLPLLIIAAVTLHLTTQGMHRTIAEEVTSLRQYSNGEIRRFLSQQQDWVTAMANAPRMKGPGPEDRKELVEAMHRLYPGFRWVGFADPTGRLTITSGGGSPEQTTLRALLPPVMQRAGMSDALPAADDPNVPVVVYSAPVTASDGHRIGTLLVEVDLRPLVSTLGEGRIRGSGETYLVRGDGLLISESRFRPGAALRLRIDTQGFREASAGRMGVATYQDYRGIPVIGAFEPFRANPGLEGSPRWALISEVDYAEAMAPAYALGRAVIFGTLLMLAMIGTAILAISRQITSPLRDLEAATNRISQGDWSLRANESSPDEFGRLAAAFNRMAAKVGATISELRHSNEALEAADRRVRLVVDNAPVFLFSVTPDGLLTFAEGQALEGFTGNGNAGTQLEKPVLEAFQDYPSFVSSLQRALRGEIDRDEVTLGSKVFQIGYAVPKGENGPSVRLVGVATDVTERKKLEARLAEAQRIAHLGSWEWDLETNQVNWSDELLCIAGIPSVDFGGNLEAFYERLFPEDRPFMEATLSRVAHEGESYEADYRLVRPNGEIRSIHSFGYVIRDENQRPIRMFGIAQDITERKRLEDTLREQYTKLQQLDQMKNDFVNAISHDLRTPLTSILGYSEFLDEGVAGPLNPQQSDFLHQIQKSTERLERLVNDLLDFARLEAGTFKLNLEEVDIVEEIRGVAETMRPQIEEAGLRLEFDFASDTQPVVADPDRIERVVANLLSNAIKFTPSGGVIRVAGHVEGDRFLCEVTDTGVGIAAADLPRLFKRFSQVAPDRLHKGGTGLGLHISKSIVEAHGGTIGVVSEPGKGSTFWFKLPLHPPTEPDHGAEA